MASTVARTPATGDTRALFFTPALLAGAFGRPAAAGNGGVFAFALPTFRERLLFPVMGSIEVGATARMGDALYVAHDTVVERQATYQSSLRPFGPFAGLVPSVSGDGVNAYFVHGGGTLSSIDATAAVAKEEARGVDARVTAATPDAVYWLTTARPTRLMRLSLADKTTRAAWSPRRRRRRRASTGWRGAVLV